MNKKGFTLVELLAVIVILAVILVIAVPQIMNVIENTKISSMETSGMLIANSAEKKYLEREILGILDQVNNPITCPDIATYSSSNYSSCTITFNNGEATISMVGIGKFDGYTCSGNKNAVECVGLQPAVTVLKNSGDMYQDDTIDQNYRYKGANPNNYVKFNGEEWRIIGIFNISGEERIKIVGELLKNSENVVLTYSWDTSPSTANSGAGYTTWETKEGKTKPDGTTTADMKELLNTLYHDGTNITCYGGTNNATKACPEARLNVTAKGMIDEVVWNFGTVNTSKSPGQAYTLERGTTVNSSDITKTEWTGKVGLIYPSDYGYANGDKDTNCSIINKNSCKTDNWLGTETSYWLLSGYPTSIHYGNFVSRNGYIEYAPASDARGIRPVVYLKSDIKITSGEGTSGDNAYELSL